MESYTCSSCGAPVAITNRFSKVLVCPYCGTHHRVTVDGLDPSGKHPALAAFPSLLNIGSRGTIKGKPFVARGRLRYRYEDGFYDEWFLTCDDEPAWFTEDEGSYTLYTEMIENLSVPDNLDTVRAGQNILIGERQIMVKERGAATVEGGEGELLHYVEPGAAITYIDGIWSGKRVSIELSEDEIEFFIGQPVLRRDIVIEA
jgi:DNA-directed RNA polymerase subunit RPC12/RpoP